LRDLIRTDVADAGLVAIASGSVGEGAEGLCREGVHTVHPPQDTPATRVGWLA
jgi:hypothetical protein